VQLEKLHRPLLVWSRPAGVPEAYRPRPKRARGRRRRA
jgi:hypothetical protein